jgi:hypothetical protein
MVCFSLMVSVLIDVATVADSDHDHIGSKNPEDDSPIASSSGLVARKADALAAGQSLLFAALPARRHYLRQEPDAETRSSESVEGLIRNRHSYADSGEGTGL